MMEAWRTPSAIYHSRCLRCRRPLKDHTSRARGYGPECWDKVRHALPPSGAPRTERRSISNIFTANHSIEQITARLNSHCPECGAYLESPQVHSYDHSDGLHLRGFLRPQWVYVSCPACGLDLALHKLTRDTCGDLCKHSSQQTLADILAI